MNAPVKNVNDLPDFRIVLEDHTHDRLNLILSSPNPLRFNVRGGADGGNLREGIRCRAQDVSASI